MIVFMLSKDDKEFERYKQGRFPHDKIIEVRGEHESGKKCDAIVRILGSDAKGNLCVLLILLLDSTAETAKDTLKDNLAGSSPVDAKDFLSQLKNILVSLMKCTDINNDVRSFLTKAIEFNKGLPKCVTEDSLLFVHWGGGAPLEYEKRFKDCLEEHLKDENERQFKSIRAYAFSSRRAEFFDVTRHRIEAPRTYSEVVELEGKFKFDQIKETLAYCAAGFDCKIDEGIRSEIRACLDGFKNRVLRSSFDTEKKNRFLKMAGNALVNISSINFDSACKTTPETAELIVKILNKEVFHG